MNPLGSIYVASRASIPERSAYWRNLRQMGYPIISSWIDEAGPGQTVSVSGLWARIQSEIQRSSGLILHVQSGDFPLKGALVEVGMALAHRLPVKIVADHELRPFLGSWTDQDNVRFTATVELAFAELGFTL